MTPEERLNRIENALDRHIEFVGRSLQVQNQLIDKNTAGIRDLIVVGRTCLDSIKAMRETHQKDYEQWSAKMNELREAQAATEEKLNILINTVDRIIRHRNGNKEPS